MRKRYRYDRDFGCMVEVTPWTGHNDPPPRNDELAAPLLQIDAYHRNPVQSPVDLTALESRQDVREHNRRNGVIDIGNDRGPDVPRRDFTADLKDDLKTAHDKIEQNHPESLAIIQASRTKPEQDMTHARTL
ncbi:MAG: hypothetical protein F4Y68_13570 [Boseongicola sp. SB0665_bin_10]|nr:hypothetical protein [Boseongicola sp. SB0665_bin_10]